MQMFTPVSPVTLYVAVYVKIGSYLYYMCCINNTTYAYSLVWVAWKQDLCRNNPHEDKSTRTKLVLIWAYSIRIVFTITRTPIPRTCVNVNAALPFVLRNLCVMRTCELWCVCVVGFHQAVCTTRLLMVHTSLTLTTSALCQLTLIPRCLGFTRMLISQRTTRRLIRSLHTLPHTVTSDNFFHITYLLISLPLVKPQNVLI